jgi:hypothetical protein
MLSRQQYYGVLPLGSLAVPSVCFFQISDPLLAVWEWDPPLISICLRGRGMRRIPISIGIHK